MSEEIEKIYCNGGCSPADMAALMGNSNNGMWNNPFVYLVWMMMFRNGWGGENGENYNSRQIAALQDSVNTNHNNDIALQAINGNAGAIRELATMLNSDFNSVQMAVCGVKSAIEKVGGQVGYSVESVKNAIALGDSNIVSKIQECCCSNKMLVQQMGYEGQLRDQANTSAIIGRIDQLANGVQQGFSQIGFNQQQNTQAIIANATANTQRILDQMCANTTQELRDKLAQASQNAQTSYLISQLKPTA